MSWLKADDKMHSHPKVKHIPRRIRLAALGLWLLCGTWSADYETDGEVPEHILDDYDASDELVEALVSAELWDRTDEGIVFRNWAEYQPTKAVKDEKRAATAERVAKHRQAKREAKNHRETPSTSSDGNAVTGGGVTPRNAPPVPEPVPVPVPTTTPQPPDQGSLLEVEASPRERGRETASVYPDAFEQLWAAWPKRRTDTAGKKAAHGAWERATRGTSRKAPRVTVESLQAAVEAYAADTNLAPEQFQPNLTTWLNQDRWENGPLPPRGGGNGRPQAGDTHRAMQRSYSAAQSYRALEESGYYDQTPQITPHMRRTA